MSAPSESTWSGRRVFVTGHTGFKGAWLALWLERLGAEVHGFALAPPSTPSLFEAAGVAAACRDVRGDVRDADAVARAMAACQPSVVFHLAAQSLVRESYRAPAETFATNVQGTIHVLEAARHVPSVRAIVVVTSDKCYENREWPWQYRESDALGGFDPYSASKGAAEIVTASYARALLAGGAGRSVGVATARAGNVIGGGDWAADRLIPDIIRAFTAGNPVLVRNPASVRPWQHVLEALNGYLRLAEHLLATAPGFDSWNFGPHGTDARPVSWIADRMTALWGGTARWVHDARDTPHEAGLLRLDASRARALLGWRTVFDLDAALRWTMEWFVAHRDGQDMRAFSRDQLARYGSLLTSAGDHP